VVYVILLELAKLTTASTDEASTKEKMVQNMECPPEQSLSGIVRQDRNSNDGSMSLRADVALNRSQKLQIRGVRQE
jgi:hypothetical protein